VGTVAPTGAGHVVVEVAGEVDLNSRASLAEELDRAAARAVPAVVVDLSAVSFFCAVGVNILEDAANALAAVGRRLHLVCPQTGAAWRVLTLLGMESEWPVHPTTADAVRAIAGASV
jgi:anti-sigma B factor antagonist